MPTRPKTLPKLDGALLTDLYQLAMLHGYFEAGMEQTAVFEFFVRRLPETRGFLVSAGQEQVLEYLETLEFTGGELEWLAAGGRFPESFVRHLERFRFTGDVHAVAEGTVFFPDEPIVRVTAPLPEAQLVETRLMNILHAQTVIASKAARIKLVSGDVPLVDFGLRRAHGAEAGLFAARASYVAGFAGTATVLAGRLYGIPIFGTMAHSFVQAHDSETQSFLDFAHARPHDITLLIDTYDTERGAHRTVEVARRLAEEGIEVKAVRIDSGDLAEGARRVRRILDEGGFPDIGIFLSGGLDEERIGAIVETGVRVDGFGVGTRLDVSEDAPSLDSAYKLQEYAGRARRKRSSGKATWPGRKQIFRRYDAQRRMSGDLLALEDERTDGEPLVEPVMRAGKRLGPPRSLESIRERCASQLAALPAHLAALDTQPPYEVTISEALRELAREVDEVT